MTDKTRLYVLAGILLLSLALLFVATHSWGLLRLN